MGKSDESREHKTRIAEQIGRAANPRQRGLGPATESRLRPSWYPSCRLPLACWCVGREPNRLSRHLTCSNVPRFRDHGAISRCLRLCLRLTVCPRCRNLRWCYEQPIIGK